ncbi:MAG: bifunctional diguanylate cyclase/phosphodiesterase [Desulfuromonas sp.]|nr:MAG: bifunctional diguanylate cyclase/phosphodiesterase [Desulfuromonas sp.]
MVSPYSDDDSDRYRELYRKTPIMMHSLDRHGRLLAISDFWTEVMGYSRDEVIGTKLTDYLSDQSRRDAEETNLPQFFRLGYIRDIPYQMVKKNGEVIDVLISASSEKDADGNVVRSMAGVIDVTEQKKADREIYRLAHFDQLTGKPNRFLLRDRLKQNLAQGAREGQRVAVLFIDLDRFKWVNDTLGHHAGDKLLKVVADRLSGCVRKVDTVARLGGDEFVVLLYGILSNEDSATFARRFLAELSRPTLLEGKEFLNSGSIGIAIYPMDGKTVDTLLRKADMAMYAAKEQGGGTYQFFSSDMAERARENLSIQNNLRRALHNQDLTLHYQPQIDLSTNRITGFEALIRWDTPSLGDIPPSRFIPVAEETGLIFPLGEWVLRTACAQAVRWHQSGLPPLRIAVNISARQFARPDFIEMIETVLQQTGLDPRLLEIELTETTVMEHIQDAIATLTDLKVRHINLAIDDFGTGFSSLVYLKNFPFDRIKIAQEFVRDITENHGHRAIVEAIIGLSRTLNLHVIAEGVEQQAQLDFLRAQQCHEVQGFFCGRPQPAAAIPQLLSSSRLH